MCLRWKFFENIFFFWVKSDLLYHCLKTYIILFFLFPQKSKLRLLPPRMPIKIFRCYRHHQDHHTENARSPFLHHQHCWGRPYRFCILRWWAKCRSQCTKASLLFRPRGGRVRLEKINGKRKIFFISCCDKCSVQSLYLLVMDRVSVPEIRVLG